jgi:PAS domain S-box-containing protein
MQLIVGVTSLDILSAVRAYVTGESLYSKGQKDAQIYLIDYAQSHREDDYQRFLAALAVPLSYRTVREELQKPKPDLAAVRRGMLGGGTHPDDVDKGIRLFRWFQSLPWMARPIATWTAGDRVIEQMIGVAQRAHERIAVGNLEAPAVEDMRARAPELNKELTDLESTFAKQLGAASRDTERMLLVLNVSLALLLGATGLAFVRYSARIQAATEGEVRRRKESLQRLLDSAAEGLYGVDLEGRCTFINRAALQMLGYSSELELRGRDIHALIRHSNASGAPHEHGQAKSASDEGDLLEVHVADGVFWRRNGSFFPVEFWSHPLREDGRLHGAVVTFFDISERIHMQAALREGEVRIAKLVDAVNDGVITIDANERIVLFNRAAERLFGVPTNVAIGTDVQRFIPRRPRRGGGLRVQKLALNGGLQGSSAVHDLTGLRPDGSEFPIEATLSKLETERGELTTVVLRDVTALHQARAEREAREALEAASRAKTEFLSRMSHELRTPLNAVLGFAQMLRLDRDFPPSTDQLKKIQYIESAGGHLLALVNDVLDLSRVETGQLTLKLESIDVESVVSDALAMVLPLASSHSVQIEVAQATAAIDDWVPHRLPGSTVWVVADLVRLRQVLVNLFSNAIKYSRPGGKVVVRWPIESNTCALSVTDDGLGMSRESLDRLFEPFNRLGAEMSKIEGTGIGLVLTRRLVQLMGGQLHIDSSVGVGTVATVVLATSAQRPEEARVLPPPSQHGGLENSMRVLYAEDNEVNVELVRQVVGLRPEVELQIAECGALALQMALADPPALMLVDMNLGDMTGIELARQLQARSSTAAIRLIALSADALPEQIDAALAAGFENYLTKPLDFRRLLDVLDGLALTQ